MRNGLFSALACLAIWSLFLPAVAQNPPETESSTTISNDGSDSARGLVFLTRLKELAKSGDLFDKESVESILALKLVASVHSQPPHMSNCSGGGGIRSYDVTSLTDSNNGWYRDFPHEVGETPVSKGPVNPTASTYHASFEYRLVHEVWCSDFIQLQVHTFAKVEFEGLPSFACVTLSNIRRAIPTAEQIGGSDGFEVVGYKGHVDDDAGTSLSFVFAPGMACAISAYVEQDQTGGLRFLRASVAYKTCEVQAARNYCSSHVHPAWLDGMGTDALLKYVNNVCGTVNALYLREPSNGKQPLSSTAVLKLNHRILWQVQHHLGPCDN